MVRQYRYVEIMSLKAIFTRERKTLRSPTSCSSDSSDFRPIGDGSKSRTVKTTGHPPRLIPQMFMGFVPAVIDSGRLEIADEIPDRLRASAYPELRPMLTFALRTSVVHTEISRAGHTHRLECRAGIN